MPDYFLHWKNALSKFWLLRQLRFTMSIHKTVRRKIQFIERSLSECPHNWAPSHSMIIIWGNRRIFLCTHFEVCCFQTITFVVFVNWEYLTSAICAIARKSRFTQANVRSASVVTNGIGITNVRVGRTLVYVWNKDYKWKYDIKVKAVVNLSIFQVYASRTMRRLLYISSIFNEKFLIYFTFRRSLTRATVQ